MAYKVIRKEFVRSQPKWLVRFLLSLTPKVYEVKETLEEAQANILAIKEAIVDAHLVGENSKLLLMEDDDSITFSSSKERPYLKFFINHNYTRC